MQWYLIKKQLKRFISCDWIDESFHVVLVDAIKAALHLFGRLGANFRASRHKVNLLWGFLLVLGHFVLCQSSVVHVHQTSYNTVGRSFVYVYVVMLYPKKAYLP